MLSLHEEEEEEEEEEFITSGTWRACVRSWSHDTFET